GGGFFGTSTSWRSFQPPGEILIDRRHKKRQPPSVSLHPPPRGNRFSIKQPGIVSLSILQPTSPCRPRSTRWCRTKPIGRERSRCPAPEWFSQTIPEQRSLSLPA